MTNKILNQLFSSCKKWKTLVLISLLLTLGVEQMWGGNVRVYVNTSAISSWWTTTYVYAWGGSTTKYAMTAVAGKSNWYYADISDAHTSLIFYRAENKDAGWWNQTVDITISGNNYWALKDEKDGSGKQKIETAGKYAPTVCITGSMNSWSPTANTFSAGSLTMTLSANTTYDFKVQDGLTFYGNNYAFEGQTTSLTMSTSDNDCHLNTGAAGTYTFTWNNSTKALTITFPSVTHPSDKYVYFKNTGNWSPVYGYLFGNGTGGGAYPGPQLETFNFDGTNYYFMARGNQTKAIFGNNNDSRKTADLTSLASYVGKYYDYSSSSWKSFTATLTLNHQSPTNTPAPNSVTVTYNAANNINTDVITTSPTKTGYTFGGYYTSQAGAGTQIIGTNEKIPSDLTGYTTSGKWTKTGSSVSATLYAKWTQTLNLNGNGATSAGTTSVTATFNGGIGTISDNPSKTGYTFQGYYPNANGTGSQVISTSKALQTNVTNWTNSSTKWIHTGSSILYAKWTQTVTLNSNTSYGGKVSGDGSVSAIYNGAISSYTAAQAASASYALKGYFTAETGGTEVIDKDGNVKANVTNWTDASGNWIHAGASTLYAQWKTTYTLHYEGNGNTGGTAPADEEWTMNTTATVASNSGSLVKTNYDFGGWNTLANGTGINYTAGSGTFTITANTNLFAKWNETMRDITIVNGTVYGGAATSTTAGVVTSAKITANAPAEGKKFTGWTLGTGVSLKTGSSLTDRTIEIYSTANATVTANYADRASVKLYFAKPSAWTKVYAYAWKESGTANGDWPGVEMTSYETVGCVNYYYYLYYTEADGIGGAATGSSTWDQVIFSNNGATQTNDLAISNGHYYYKADAAASSGREAALASAWLVKGDFNSWGETDVLTPNCGANTATKTISLTTGNKTFKIYNAVNDQWWRVTGNISATKAATTMNNSDGDMTLTPTVAGNYVFTVGSTNSTPTLAVTFPISLTWTAASVYSGDAATISATANDIVSGKSIKFDVYAGATATGAVLATWSGTTSSTSHTQNLSVTPSFGANETSKQYTVKVTYDGSQTATYTSYVYRKWDIYVHDVQNWNQIKLYMWKGMDKSAAYPGELCPLYNSSTSWYIVTLDGRYSEGFVLSADGDATKTANHTPSISTYESGTYWYVNKYQGGTLTSVSITDPTVVVTSATIINTHQIKLIGNVTNFGGDGSTSGELKEVGFYLGETKYTAGCTSNSNGTFTKVITNLTAGTQYTIKAFATNIHGTAQSATQNISTRADGTTRIKVRSAIARPAPKIHAWTSAEDCGGVKEENAASLAGAPAMTLFITGSVYKWYYYDISNDYNHFQITDGDVSVASMGQANPFDATCYWYHPTEAQQGQRLGTMTCPYETPQLMIETTAGSGTFEYYEMTGSGTVSKTMALSSNSTYEFKPVYNAEWYSKTGASTLTRESNTTAALNASDENNLSITTDFAGDYTFSFNTSTKVLSVTYPEAFKVTYNANSASGGSVPTESGTYYLSGSDVTLANNSGYLYKEGYAFNGWNTAATPSGSSTHYASGGTLPAISANQTLYAEWVANDYTMYFFNKDDWSPADAYMWSANNDPELAYPGRTMTQYQGQVYQIDYNHNVQAKVVFNNGQTGVDERKTNDYLKENDSFLLKNMKNAKKMNFLAHKICVY